MAEDIETSCKELKASEGTYILVAGCFINNTIKVIDSTVTVSEELYDLFADETIRLSSDKQLGDILAFYMNLKKHLAAPDYKNQDYVVPLNFLDIVKNRADISEIKYNSFYTQKHNIVLWNENKNRECNNSKVIKNINQ